MAAVTASLIIAGAGIAMSAYSAKRGRDQARDAKKDAKAQMMRAEREKQIAGERAEGDAGRDMASLRRRLLGSFGRGTNLMKTAPTEGAYGKTLIGS
jgi:hypothetical protein